MSPPLKKALRPSTSFKPNLCAEEAAASASIANTTGNGPTMATETPPATTDDKQLTALC